MRLSWLPISLCVFTLSGACGEEAAPDGGDDLGTHDGPSDAGGEDRIVGDAEPLDAIPLDGDLPDSGPTGIGPAGGTLAGPNGAVVIVPSGALTTFVDLKIELIHTSTPAFPPAGVVAAGALFALTPHGTTFLVPVTIRLPYDEAAVPVGEPVRLYRAQPGGEFTQVASATIAGAFLQAEVDGFSLYGPGYEPPVTLGFSELQRQCARESLAGNVWCWGEQGVIARGSGLSEPQPRESVFREPTRLPPRALTNIAVGPGWVCGLDVLDVWCLGDWKLTRTAPPPATPPVRQWVQKTLPSGVVLEQLTAGGYFVCGLASVTSPDPTVAGQIYCWGDNTVGQLGRDLYSDPWEVLPVTTPNRYATLGAAGAFVCAARVLTGEVDCWGSNIYGGVAAYALGSFDMTTSPIPRGLVVDPRPGALAGGNSNFCGLQVDGTAYCWGDNDYGQMGNGTTSPYGQNYRAPSEVPGIKFKSLWPGQTMCGIGLDDRSYCWGFASRGSIGDGHDDAGGAPADTSKQKVPTLVVMPSGVTFESMSIGDRGRCARSTRNEVYCWGDNEYFGLGTGLDTPAWSNVPVPIKSSHLTRVMP